MREGCEEVVPATVGFGLFLLGNLAIGDVLDCEQDQLIAAILGMQPVSVQQHRLLADFAETMGNLEIPQCTAFGQNSLEQPAEPGDVPLAVSEIVKIPLQRLLRPKM